LGNDIDVASFDVTTEGVTEIIRWLRNQRAEVIRVGIEDLPAGACRC
jgi:hypothetical protein